MSVHPSTVLVVGATGSIGRYVMDEALREGYGVRALVRDSARARGLPGRAQLVIGDLTRPQTLAAAVDGIDAIVFTHGSDGQSRAGAEHIDYGGVRNVLEVLGGRQVRIALMTAIGATDRNGAYNRATEAHDWKRRSERLVRTSGLPYTIVRPGWFDRNDRDQWRLVAVQGDTRHSGTPADGVVARRQIAEVLVRSLSSSAADHKTFELIAEHGPATEDFDALFALSSVFFSGLFRSFRGRGIVFPKQAISVTTGRFSRPPRLNRYVAAPVTIPDVADHHSRGDKSGRSAGRDRRRAAIRSALSVLRRAGRAHS